MNNKLILLSGKPFSGKSYLGKKIAEITKAKYISFDEFWVKLETEDKYKGKLSFEFQTKYLEKLILDYLKEGHTVIYDSLNDTPDQRDNWREFAQKLNKELVIIFLDTPDNEIEKRRDENLNIKTRHDVSDERFHSAVKKFVDPTGEDNVVVFKPDDVIADWVQKYLI